jgi:hypothetical protein
MLLPEMTQLRAFYNQALLTNYKLFVVLDKQKERKEPLATACSSSR